MHARVSTPSARIRRSIGVVLGVAALSSLLASTALAGKPERGPSGNAPLEFAAGEVCDHAIRFENTTLRSHDTLFDPASDGSQRLATTGSAVSVVTDLTSGATIAVRGGFQFSVVFLPDGAVRVDVHGTDILAWYYPGDDSDLPPGLWLTAGDLHEWYAADGTFLRATFHGHATDVCAALGG